MQTYRLAVRESGSDAVEMPRAERSEARGVAAWKTRTAPSVCSLLRGLCYGRAEHSPPATAGIANSTKKTTHPT